MLGLRQIVKLCLAVYITFIPSYLVTHASQPGSPLILRLQQTFASSNCSSGEVYINGKLISLYMASNENIFSSSEPFVNSGKITISAVRGRFNSVEYISVVFDDGRAQTILNTKPASFSSIKRPNDREKSKHQISLNPFISNRTCDGDRQFTEFDGDYDNINNTLLSATGMNINGGVIERAFFVKDIPIGRIYFQDKDGTLRFDQTKIGGPICPNYYESLNSRVRNERVLGLSECLKWSMSGKEEASLIEFGRTTRFIVLQDEAPFGVYLGLPVFPVFYLPIDSAASKGFRVFGFGHSNSEFELLRYNVH